MARKKTAKKAAKKTNRGSPEAIAKRRVARALNQLFSADAAGPALDGRTLKRKRRLMAELKEGKNGQPLKALTVLGHATELLGLGETLGSLRKLKPKLPPRPAPSAETTTLIADVQKLYGFDPAAWKLLGISLEPAPAKPAPAAKKKTRRKR